MIMKVKGAPPPLLRAQPIHVTVNHTRVQIPSVYCLGSERIEALRYMRSKAHLKQIYSTVDYTNIKENTEHANTTALMKLPIMKILEKARDTPDIRFSTAEITILLQIFFRVTRNTKHVMTPQSLRDFLYTNLDITHGDSLDGIARALVRLRTGAQRPNNNNISPIDFLRVLSYMMRGNLEERALMAFYLLDMDDDGHLRRQVEIRSFLSRNWVEIPDLPFPIEAYIEALRYLSTKLLTYPCACISKRGFVELAKANPWIVTALLYWLPTDRVNLSFQALFARKAWTSPTCERIRTGC